MAVLGTDNFICECCTVNVLAESSENLTHFFNSQFDADRFGTALLYFNTVPEVPHTVHASNTCSWLGVLTGAHSSFFFLWHF